MADNYQIVFVRAGDGSPAAQKSVAERIATASKTPIAKLLAQIESAPFVYKRALPKAKADAIAATLSKLGAVTEVNEEGTPLTAAGGGFGAAGGGFGATPATDNFGAAGFGAAGGGFGAPATPAVGGFSFGEPPPAVGVGGFSAPNPPATPGGNAFGFGTSSGEFSIEDPGTATPAGGSGFDFSVGAATSSVAPPTMAASPVGVEDNLAYASASGEHTSKQPPPIQKGKAARMNCPRCGQEVPDAPECSSCGVVFAKAGAVDNSASSGAGRRPRPRAQEKAKTSSTRILAAAGIIALILVGAFLGGAFTPIRVRLAAGGNAMLKSYGVDVSAPVGGFARATISNADRGQDMATSFIGRSDRITAEIARLSSLSSMSEFEQGASALKTEIDAYLAHPALGLREEVRKVLAPFYPVQAVGLTFEGKTYSFKEEAAIAEAGGLKGVLPVLSDVEIRRLLDSAKKQVSVQEEQRQGSERRVAVDVDLADNFDSGQLNPRWQVPADAAPQFSQGWLYLTARPGKVADGPRILAPEPEADYTLTVTVSLTGAAKDTSHAGLVIMQGDQHWVSLVRAGRRAGKAVQVVTDGGPGPDAQCDDPVTIQIERRGNEYAFSYWHKQRLVKLDRIRPFAEPKPRSIGLAAFGGTTGFFFDNFQLTINR